MHDSVKIIIGLLIFIGLVTVPFYYGSGSNAAMPEPSLDTPIINMLSTKKCVESREYMRANHMQLLNEWRDAVVRDGERTYKDEDGKEITRSLQNTCLGCHSNKEAFCDRCHTYTNVKPYCWDCHLGTKEKKT